MKLKKKRKNNETTLKTGVKITCLQNCSKHWSLGTNAYFLSFLFLLCQVSERERKKRCEIALFLTFARALLSVINSNNFWRKVYARD